MALVFALRDASTSEVHPFSGLPELRLDGLGETDAQALLAAGVRTPLDDEVRERIVAEARGNPLALLELPRSTPPTQLAGGFELPDTLSVPHRIEDGFRRRSGSLPAETQLLLLVAAADPTGDVALLWRAAAQLGIARRGAAPAEAAGLLEIDTRVRFRHPLVRSAVYRAATPPDQRRAHGALAAATDPQVDPDRRAWHRAQAVLGTDEEAAAELERSADRARARGGLAAAAAFLQHAAELTPDPAARARRALEAAHAKHEAGASESALELLTAAPPGRWTPCNARTRAAARPDRVPPDARQRGAGNAAGRRQDVRPAGRRAGPRDLPTRARRGDRHRRLRRGVRSPKPPWPHPHPRCRRGRWTCCLTGSRRP